MTRLWFREKRQRSYHALRRMADTKYLCGKVANKLAIIEQDQAATSGQLCSVCFRSGEGEALPQFRVVKRTVKKAKQR